MTTTTIFTELLVLGFFMLCALLFSVLSVFEIYDLSFIASLKDLSTIIALAVTVISYCLGTFVHHIEYSVRKLVGKVLSLFQETKGFRLLLRLKPFNTAMQSRQVRWQKMKDINDGKVLFFILENGSIETIKRITQMHSTLWLFRGISAILPALGFGLSSWLAGYYQDWRIGFTSLLIFFFAFLISLSARHTKSNDTVREMMIAQDIIHDKIFMEFNYRTPPRPESVRLE